MGRIVLTTIGALGDLHPLIAIALDPKARGHLPVLAVSEDHVAKARGAGLEAVAVLPNFETVWRRMGRTEKEAVARHGESANQPPHTPGFWMIKGDPKAPIGWRWNGLVFKAARGDFADPEMDAFSDAEPSPVVFTLRSFAVHAPGNIYFQAAATARRLGLRAVLLTGGKSNLTSGGDILVRDYAPHSRIFPRAAAIVHRAGIGITGQALRAGKPQLVVPHIRDQADNAHRNHRLHFGRVLASNRLNAERGARRLAWLLDSMHPYREEAARVGASVATANGAAAAAAAIARARCAARAL